MKQIYRVKRGGMTLTETTRERDAKGYRNALGGSIYVEMWCGQCEGHTIHKLRRSGTYECLDCARE